MNSGFSQRLDHGLAPEGFGPFVTTSQVPPPDTPNVVSKCVSRRAEFKSEEKTVGTESFAKSCTLSHFVTHSYTVTATPRSAMIPTSVVVVPSGCPVRCLRRDMATDLVFEVWVMVLRGLLHDHLAQGPEGVDRVWL